MKSYTLNLQRAGAVLLVLCFFCTFLYGCGGDFVSRGQQVKFHGEVEIYLASGEDEYFPLNDELVEILLEDAKWLARNGGMLFIEKTASIKADTVRWTLGVTEYSCEGAIITASGVVRIEDDCPEGENWIDLVLPNLMLLSEITDTVPMITGLPPERAVMDSVVPIERIHVFTTDQEASTARWRATGITVGFLVVLVIIWAVVSHFLGSSD